MAMELRVPALGESVREATLGAWKHAEGDEVSVDEPLGEVDAEIEQLAAGATQASPAKATNGRKGASSDGGNGRPAAETAVRAAPSARRALAESGLSADEVKGSGRGGRISKQDVTRALQSQSESQS